MVRRHDDSETPGPRTAVCHHRLWRGARFLHSADGSHTGCHRPLCAGRRRRGGGAAGHVLLRVAVLQGGHTPLFKGQAERVGAHPRLPPHDDTHGGADHQILRRPHQCRQPRRLHHHGRRSLHHRAGKGGETDSGDGLHDGAQLSRRQRRSLLGGVLDQEALQPATSRRCARD